jgi:YfiH family protein
VLKKKNNFYSFHNLSQEKMCRHLVTQKEKNSPYSFSLALHTKEDPKEIIRNREQLSKNFLRTKFIVANQTHSANIHIVNENKELGWSSLKSAIENCDALITNKPKVMLTILTADCVPILLFDPIEKIVASVHAGWKGTEQEILFKTVKKMEETFGTKPKNILAGIAPSIGKCCYEVDWDVAQHFKNIENAYDKKEEKYMLDLPHINKLQLLNADLKKENIEMSNICTACNVKHYFSYRKENGCSGRFMSMIGLI